ncbi:hypothetical protein, partial [Burkholderia sp. SIMBA_024]|uniref:hypothetical protein n=1 Tax=Burkholderia sp. SIMBA_024 TaxID=3085768 RepID=UPI00397DF140
NNQAQLTTTGPLVVNGGRAGGSSAYGVYVRGTGRIALASGSVFNLSGLQPVGINAAGGVIAAGDIGDGVTINLLAPGSGAGGTGVLANAGG